MTISISATPAATAATPSSTQKTSTANSTTTTTSVIQPTFIFSTPALTTTFTPPPSCTEGKLTMLERQSYFVWQNEPLPVPNTTFSDCYPSQFITSYIDAFYSTILPAFSPLVCPENYYTVFNQSMTDRPLYIACCPSSFGFAPPSTSTEGRPAFGGTCYSDILTTTITQYDNSSSSGVMRFTTSGQAYAHPFDGYALDQQVSFNAFVGTNSAASNTSNGTNSLGSSNTGAFVQSPPLSGGAIAGIVIGSIAAVAFLLIGFILVLRRRKGKTPPVGLDRRSLPDDRTPYGSNQNIKHMQVSEKALPPPPGYYQPHKVSELSPAWPRNPGELQPSGRYSPRQELPDNSRQVAMELDGSEASMSRKTSNISAWTRNPMSRLQTKSPLVGPAISPGAKAAVSPPDKAVSPISLADRNET